MIPASLRRSFALFTALAIASPALVTAAPAPPAIGSAAPHATTIASSPETAPTDSAVDVPTTNEVPAPAPPVPSSRGSFSGGRLVVEMLASAVVGSLVGYGVYSAVGGDGIGPVLAGLGAEIVVAPLVVYGAGRAMGGQGTLGMAYLGGLIAFSGPSATPQEASISFAVGMALMPVTSAVIYEVSSHVRSKRAAAVARAVSLAPVGDRSGVTGVRASVSVAF
ncbi:MAG: hypothetical protein WKG01_25355 [Kofleriaceae bacterium]